MNTQDFKNQLGDYAKDIKLNLSAVLTVDATTGLSQTELYGIALASAYATKHQPLVAALLGDEVLDNNTINAARAASTIMAMNNIYYRFIHLVSDKAYQSMPAKLRMNVIANPGIDKADFEMMGLAVSAINGCGLCIDSHERALAKLGTSKAAIQTIIRIAAVINAAAQADVIGVGLEQEAVVA